jgi:hypothetical protein
MKDFFENFEISEPLEPRHAFFGGRTTRPARREDPLRGFQQPLPMVCILLKTFNSNVLVVNLLKKF